MDSDLPSASSGVVNLWFDFVILVRVVLPEGFILLQETDRCKDAFICIHGYYVNEETVLEKACVIC